MKDKDEEQERKYFEFINSFAGLRQTKRDFSFCLRKVRHMSYLLPCEFNSWPPSAGKFREGETYLRCVAVVFYT